MEIDSGREHLFSARFACPVCSYSLPELEPRLFSFNNPMGACPRCDGLGTISFFAILGVLLVRLDRARRRWRDENAERADLATAFELALVGWLITSVFLHLSYQRYLWILVALAAASLHVLRATDGVRRRERVA